MILRLLILFCALPLMAANSITPGSVTLRPTFECIGVAANYSGDDNANAVFHVRYKKTAGSVWFNAYYSTNAVDRRATVGGFDNTGNSNQARVSIVGCTAGTSYDVVTIWTDADGGSASATNSATTLAWASSVPTNGNIVYVDSLTSSEGIGTVGSPFKTITNALKNIVPGDTVSVNAGTYVPFTMTNSGTPTAWIVFRKFASGAVTITGGVGSTQNIDISGCSNIVFDGWSYNSANVRTFTTSAGTRNVFIQNSTANNVGLSSAAFNSFITVGGCSNLYILTNTISGFSKVSDSHGIQFGNSVCDSIVIGANTISYWWDGIGGGGNYGPNLGVAANCDIFGNTVYDVDDDPIEAEGGGKNVRVWGNRTFGGTTGLGFAPILAGPTYVWRNIVIVTNASAIKAGNNAEGPAYFFHNTISTAESSTGGWEATGESGGTPHSKRYLWLNNILTSRGNTIYKSGATNYYDYNLHFTVAGADYVSDWNLNTAADYSSLAAFQSATSMEPNGVSGHPGISNYITGQLTNSSPARNVGQILTNFNDSSSAWPFEGAAPDIGAFEFFGTRDSDGETNALSVTATIAPGARRPGGRR